MTMDVYSGREFNLDDEESGKRFRRDLFGLSAFFKSECLFAEQTLVAKANRIYGCSGKEIIPYLVNEGVGLPNGRLVFQPTMDNTGNYLVSFIRKRKLAS